MSAPSFTTSKSMLMHAALACVSPELTTLNDIIQCGYNPIPESTVAPTNSKPPTQHGRHPPRIPRLPTEILLLVREWLVPEVTAARQTQSLNALKAYERALRDLLCEDCLLYNLDIYGPNIWEWEQFTSACSCREPGVPKGYRSTSTPSERRARSAKPGDVYDSISVSASGSATSTSDVNPKQFLDAGHWLEWHLSREAALCVGYRGHEASSLPGNNTSVVSDSASEATTPARTTPAFDVDIWHVVAVVLREFDCEAVREAEDAMSAHQRAAYREQFRIPSHNHVGIVAQRTQEDPQNVDSERLKYEREWGMQCRVRWAYRELGLWSDYPDTFSDYLSQLSPPPTHSLRACIGVETPDSYLQSLDLVVFKESVDLLLRLLQVSLTIAVGLVTAPLTLTTFALTALCYYSRPKVFRLL